MMENKIKCPKCAYWFDTEEATSEKSNYFIPEYTETCARDGLYQCPKCGTWVSSDGKAQDFYNCKDQLNLNFDFNYSELKAFFNWKVNLPEAHSDVFGDEHQFIFKFRTTKLGVVKTVEREADGEKIDLTNYEEWL